MSPVISSEDGKPTCKTFISLGKSVKVAVESKQIDLMRNTDYQKRPKLYHVIDIKSIYNKTAYDFFFFARAQMYHFNN